MYLLAPVFTLFKLKTAETLHSKNLRINLLQSLPHPFQLEFWDARLIPPLRPSRSLILRTDYIILLIFSTILGSN